MYIVRNITECHLAQLALSESEERYRSLVEEARELITVVQGRKVVLANAAASRLLGWLTEGMVGQRPERFYHPDGLPQVMERYQRRLAGELVSGIFATSMVAR